MIEGILQGTVFRELDIQFARFLVSVTGESSLGLILGSALASRAVGEGNVCLNLREVAAAPLPQADQEGETERDQPQLVCPDFDRWISDLRASSAVGKPGEARPLVLDEAGRLYLHRYWSYESTLASRILYFATHPVSDLDLERLKQNLDALFPAGRENGPDLQKLAALTAVLGRFCVISGGPGTGKTWVVARILELLARQRPSQRLLQKPVRRLSQKRSLQSEIRPAARDDRLVVALAAPTGKAAARLVAAVGQYFSNARAREVGLSWEGSTMHRLLGRLTYDPGYRPDVLVVDEASMADLGLMARLMAALPEGSRIVWLGDKDQLSSVEAGAVLGDVCAGSETEAPSPGFSQRICEIMGIRPEEVFGKGLSSARSEAGAGHREKPGGFCLRDCIVLLNRSYRFSAGSLIGVVSSSINRGEGAAALDLMRNASRDDVVWVDPDTLGSEESAGRRKSESPGLGRRSAGRRQARGWERNLIDRIVRGFSSFTQARTPEEAFERFLHFRVLCALRKGPFGVESLNRAIERWLEAAGLINPYQRWYRGRPILVTENDYTLGLYNGDVGIAFPQGGFDTPPVVFFRGPEGALRSLRPSVLPEHETVYAVTVHKSQGSEFDEVLFLLPDRPSRVLTRELLYTGITRAMRRVVVWGREEIIMQAIARRIERSSGLRDALWGEPETKDQVRI
jgi:exodeoxyribonuclease V alpha subunit